MLGLASCLCIDLSANCSAHLGNAGPAASNLIGALFCTLSVLSFCMVWRGHHCLITEVAWKTKKAAQKLCWALTPIWTFTLVLSWTRLAVYWTHTRLHSEAALAALCGTSPLQASSGKTQRHRLNRGGDRQANNALWTIAMVRMRSDARTRDYVAKRTSQGLSKKEIHRCLKRYIVRELYPLILADLKDSASPA